jgi:HlyD family secretion protein
MQQNSELNNLKGKLNALSVIIKLGHEAFEKADLETLAAHIVNNSRTIVPYCRSGFIDMRHAPKIVALMGQPSINHNSEYCLNLTKLADQLRNIDQLSAVTEKLLSEQNISSKVNELVEYFSQEGRSLYIIPLKAPTQYASGDDLFFWTLEFDTPAEAYLPLVTLLTKHYNEAVWFAVKAEKQWFSTILKRNLVMKKIALLAVIIMLPLLALVRVDQNIKASFEIVPSKEHIYFAPYSGIIKKCYFKDSNQVTSGQTVIVYKDEQIKFKLATAKNNLAKTQAEYERILHKSFADKSYLSQLKLLKLQQHEAEIAINENRWFLNEGQLKAKQAGILSIDEAETLAGKAVNAGEKLFEILTNDGMAAKITVDEKDAAVLSSKKPRVVLFLHTRPESPMTGETMIISPKPELTDLKTYCYTIKMELPEKYYPQLKCGMRGIARISGDRVSLGYYLFKNLVLWWRTI